ncbi:MAG: Trp biosynthesis-associated membrane protein [Nocardioidaceae bacterium]|nr:Trp biosynthesis-associated membrane protein [Nocardioidaceae bacterium]
MTGQRSHFAPVVLAGLATAGLGAVAAAKPWFTAALDAQQRLGVREADRSADMPLALALALVVLAAWGVALVGRTAARRVVLGIAALASAGLVACVVVAPTSLPDQVRDQIGGDRGSFGVDPSGWYVVAAIASVLGLVVVVMGWLLAPRWPTMSSRYDAPATRRTREAADETSLWKALDEGRDPTGDPTGDPMDPGTP